MRTIIVFTALSLFGIYAHAAGQVENARNANQKAERITGVDLQTYDCFLRSIDARAGKCELIFTKEDQDLKFLASPEVAAVYANPSKYAHPPYFNLTITVSGQEVLRIEDKDGERISNKIDFSR